MIDQKVTFCCLTNLYVHLNTNLITEATAAQKAGVHSLLITREGNAELADEAKKSFTVISSFADVCFESSGKRKNEDSEAIEVCGRRKSLKTALYGK